MAKKRFNPFIMLGGPLNPGDDSGDADRTGQHGYPNPPPQDGGNSIVFPRFEEWAATGVDYDGNGVDFNDYGQWWADQGYSLEAWSALNPNSPFSWSPHTATDVLPDIEPEI